jgi:hypothetical protein
MVPGVGRGHNREMFILKKTLLQNQQANAAIKLCTEIFCMMGIQVYSNKCPSPLQRGDNHKSAKIG